MSDWVLVCWLCGDPFHEWREIRVSPGTGVAELERMVRHGSLAGDSSAVDIYKVPDDRPVSEGKALGELSISVLGEPLQTTRSLSDYFLELPPPGGLLHIIINISLPITVDCWRRGASPTACLMVDASTTGHVDSIKAAIKAQLPGCDVSTYRLELFKISPTDDLNVILKTVGSGALLHGEQPLKLLFTGVPFSTEPLRIRVVAEWVDDSSAQKRTRSEDEAPEFGQVKQAKIAHESTSKFSQPRRHRELCRSDDQERVIDHRPFHREKASNAGPSSNPSSSLESELPPIFLQYEGFGKFLDVYRAGDEAPGMDPSSLCRLMLAVNNFADLMSHVFPNENARMDVGLPALKEILSIDLTPAPLSNNSTSDGHVLGPHRMACCIIEFKNELGGVSSIPYQQLTGYFAHSVKTAGETDPALGTLVERSWNVPCLGAQYRWYGHLVAFHAIIYIGRYRTVELTPMLSCIQEAGQRRQLFAAFKAVCFLLDDIIESATKQVHNPSPVISSSRLLLSISGLSHPHGGIPIKFTVDSRLFPDNQRLFYDARTTDNKKIVIKFSSSYSLELHEFCANQGCAPALLGFERVPGGPFAVAMEFVEDACEITKSSYTERHGEWVTRLRSLVQAFHRQGLVHGDLRSRSIICDGQRIMLVGFDLAGRVGSATYPVSELSSDLTSGRDVQGLKITQDDDWRTLDRTLNHIILSTQ